MQSKRVNPRTRYVLLLPARPEVLTKIVSLVNSISIQGDTGTLSHFCRLHTGSIQRWMTTRTILRWLTKKWAISRGPANTSRNYELTRTLRTYTAWQVNLMRSWAIR